MIQCTLLVHFFYTIYAAHLPSEFSLVKNRITVWHSKLAFGTASKVLREAWQLACGLAVQPAGRRPPPRPPLPLSSDWSASISRLAVPWDWVAAIWSLLIVNNSQNCCARVEVSTVQSQRYKYGGSARLEIWKKYWKTRS
jgi:hypothetical protein